MQQLRSSVKGTRFPPIEKAREKTTAVRRQIKPTATAASRESKVKPEETSANVKEKRARASTRNDR
jgi:hypothetical protein